jgi:hypothetical protein
MAARLLNSWRKGFIGIFGLTTDLQPDISGKSRFVPLCKYQKKIITQSRNLKFLAMATFLLMRFFFNADFMILLITYPTASYKTFL